MYNKPRKYRQNIVIIYSIVRHLISAPKNSLLDETFHVNNMLEYWELPEQYIEVGISSIRLNVELLRIVRGRKLLHH